MRVDQELEAFEEELAKTKKAVADRKERLNLLARFSAEMDDDTDTGFTAQHERKVAFFKDFMHFAQKHLPDFGEDTST